MPLSQAVGVCTFKCNHIKGAKQRLPKNVVFVIVAVRFSDDALIGLVLIMVLISW